MGEKMSIIDMIIYKCQGRESVESDYNPAPNHFSMPLSNSDG